MNLLSENIDSKSKTLFLSRFKNAFMKPQRGFTLVEIILVVAALAVLSLLGASGISAAVNNSREKTTYTSVMEISRDIAEELYRSPKLGNRQAGLPMSPTPEQLNQIRHDNVQEVFKMMENLNENSVIPLGSDYLEGKLYPMHAEDSWGNPYYVAVSFYDNPHTGMDTPTAGEAYPYIGSAANTKLKTTALLGNDRELRIYVVSAGKSQNIEFLNSLFSDDTLYLPNEGTDVIWCLTQMVNSSVESVTNEDSGLKFANDHALDTSIDPSILPEHVDDCGCLLYAYINYKE